MVGSCDALPPVIVYPNALHRIHPHCKWFGQLSGVWTPTHDASVWRKINFGGYRFRRTMAPTQSPRQTTDRSGNWAKSKCSSSSIPPFSPYRDTASIHRKRNKVNGNKGSGVLPADDRQQTIQKGHKAMNLIELVPAHSRAYRREIRRMTAYDRRTRTGIVQPDKSWQVILLFAASVLFGAFAVARWWMCV